MNLLLNGFLRLIGFGKAVDALDGETSKAYLGGAVKILGGLSSVVLGLANIGADLVSAKGSAAYFAIGQSLFNGNPDTAAIGLGVIAIGAGISSIGQRHAVAKAAKAATP